MTTVTTNSPVYDSAQVAALLGIAFTPEQVAAVGTPPAPREGYVTFFDPGWSILKLRESVGENGLFFYHSWYDTQEFAKAVGEACYRRIRREPVPGSFWKTYSEQLALLLEGEEVPDARMVVTMLVIHFLASKERLFETCYVRTADLIVDGRVVVGSFDNMGLSINRYWDDSIYLLGLATSGVP